LAGRRIPLLGRAKTRIDVGIAARDVAELERGAGTPDLGNGEPREKGFGLGRALGTAFEGGQRVDVGYARPQLAKWTARKARLGADRDHGLDGMVAGKRDVEGAQRWRVDHAEHRLAT